MNPYIPTTNYTKKLNTIAPTGAPCPVCGRGELWESPNVYGCDSCLRTFTETELCRIVADILDGVSNETIIELREHVAVCVTDEAHIRVNSDCQHAAEHADWLDEMQTRESVRP